MSTRNCSVYSNDKTTLLRHTTFVWPSYDFCATLFFQKLVYVTFIRPSCDFCKTLVCYDSKVSQSLVVWLRGLYFLSFFSRINRFWSVTKKNTSKAWDALKAEDTHIAFHPRMENSVCTLFFNASLFLRPKKSQCPVQQWSVLILRIQWKGHFMFLFALFSWLELAAKYP